MIKREGFTLLELMIVIVIIGILASIAVPTYIRVKQRAYKAEALASLSATRQSEYRYHLEKNVYTATLTALDFDPASDVKGTLHFVYTAVAAGTGDTATFTITATRNTVDGGVITDSVTIDQDGDIGGTGIFAP